MRRLVDAMSQRRGTASFTEGETYAGAWSLVDASSASDSPILARSMI